MNPREWRHFFKLRNDLTAHPQMREVAGMMLAEFKNAVPVIFDDLEV
jgi:thymidylate synthase (FAD)